jgi:hypothetical protein
MLLAGFIFLYFMAAIRGVLGSAESPVRGSAQLARVAFAGAVTGIAGMTMAFLRSPLRVPRVPTRIPW